MLRRDNLRLMQELVDTQRNYQDTLRATLSEQQMQMHLLQQIVPSRTTPDDSIRSMIY